MLYKISQLRRKERYDNGSVSINNIRLWFSLNEEDNKPSDFGVYELHESNYLVEEFMLLANITVANVLYEKYKGCALLRRHEAPKEENIEKYLKQILETGKVNIDIENTKSLQESIQNIENINSDYGEVVRSRCIKFMNRAKYCSSGEFEENELVHFALHVDHYTHFTSPIRRYPDIIVHRQLKSIILHKSSPYISPIVSRISKNCNNTKYNAKKAQDDSINLYLIYLLQERLKETNRAFYIEDALILGFESNSIEVLLPKYGVEDKISLKQLINERILKKVDNNSDSKETEVEVYWNKYVNIDNAIDRMEGIKDKTLKNKKKKRDMFNEETKQVFRIFDRIKVLLVPQIEKLITKIYLAPPDAYNPENVELYEYKSEKNGVNKEHEIKIEDNFDIIP